MTIKSVNDGLDYVQDDVAVSLFGVIEKIVIFEDVSLAKNLLTKGKEYLKNVINKTVSIEVSAADLHNLDVNIDTFKIRDNVRVISRPHGLDRDFLLSKLHLTLDNVTSCTMTLGATFKSFTQKQIESEKQFNNTVLNASNMVTEVKQSVQNLDEQVQLVSTTITEIPNAYVKIEIFETYKQGVNRKLENKCTMQDIEKQFVKMLDFEKLEERVKTLEDNNIENGGTT